MLQGISIESLLGTLASFGYIILKLVLLYLVMRIGSALFVWIWRTIFVPIFEKRAYFYSYNQEGVFYHERKILGIFRFGRNFRSRINDTLVGYVATKRGRKNENSDANRIYLKRRGRTFVGEAKAKYLDGKEWKYETNNKGERVCNIYLTFPGAEGGTEFDPNPVGYVDQNGKVFKYYLDREHWKKDIKLEEPEFIGQCETPKAKDGKKDPTGGERDDADVLQYIQWEANESNFFKSEEDCENNGGGELSETIIIDERRTFVNKEGKGQMDGTWLFFRRNRPFFRKVKSKQMDGGNVKDGARFPYAFLSSKLWRILHVYPTYWDCKAMAWGYGYCLEGFRNPFKQKSEDYPMITRAAAALLLAQKEGFYLDPDEVVSDGVPGAAATALFSLLVYILLYPFLLKLSSVELFQFLGKEYSSVITLVGLYFILWLCIINPIRCIVRLDHDGFESFLELLNKNVGVLGWMSTIIVATVIGALGAAFLKGFDYVLIPLFLSTLTAVLFNWAFYHQEPWAISGIYEDFKKDDSEEENNKQEEEKKEDQEGNEKIRHQAQLYLPTKRINFDEMILIDSEKLKQLRIENPFRKSLISDYENTVHDMIQREFNGDLYSKIMYLRSRVGAYVNKYHLSSVEKVKLILRICQPENVDYQYDHECPELYEGFDEENPLLQKNLKKGFREYCRFPTETIHDKRGDCDCHAAFGAALLAACGYRSCFSLGNTALGYHAMCGIECTPELQAYCQPDNSFVKDGMTFILLETTGQFGLEDKAESQESMSEDNTTVIIEPYQKKEEDDKASV